MRKTTNTEEEMELRGNNREDRAISGRTGTMSSVGWKTIMGHPPTGGHIISKRSTPQRRSLSGSVSSGLASRLSTYARPGGSRGSIRDGWGAG